MHLLHSCCQERHDSDGKRALVQHSACIQACLAAMPHAGVCRCTTDATLASLQPCNMDCWGVHVCLCLYMLCRAPEHSSHHSCSPASQVEHDHCIHQMSATAAGARPKQGHLKRVSTVTLQTTTRRHCLWHSVPHAAEVLSCHCVLCMCCCELVCKLVATSTSVQLNAVGTCVSNSTVLHCCTMLYGFAV